MDKRKTIVNTSNREVYEKLTLLHFYPEVTLHNVQSREIGKILANINKDKPILSKQVINNIITIKKLQPLNIQVYLK